MEASRKVREQQTGEIGQAFNQLYHTYTVCMQLTLSKYGLYPGQPQVLFALRTLERPTQNELAEHLGVGKASAGISLRRLEAGGFIRRVRDKKDTRCMRLALTKKGEEYARWCEIDYNMFYTTMLEAFTHDEQDGVLRMLRSMEQSLQAFKARLDS